MGGAPVSAGSVALAGDATPAEILEAADQAMYARKKKRRDQGVDT